jgi:DNA-binding beta-propeller fold protein YncE
MRSLLLIVTVGVASISGADDLLVCDLLGDQVLRYDGTTGAFLEVFASGPFDGPEGMTVGPDGNVYVASEYSANVTKWSPEGAYLGEFVAPGAGGLTGEQDLEFGPDGNLYVMSHITLMPDSVWKFNGTTGAFMGMHGLGGGPGHTHGMSWRPSDGDLYQGNLSGPPEVRRFDGPTGAMMAPFTAHPSMPITNDILWGPDDDLYVSNPLIDGFLVGGISRFDGATGTYMGTFTDVGGPASTWGMAFKDGYLYYTADGSVLRVLASTGGLATPFVTSGSGGLSFGASIAFLPIPEPSTCVILGAGGMFLLLRRKRAMRR